MTEIVLANGNELEREGIASLLENLPGHHVVARCSDGRQAVREVNRIRPDIAIFDLSLPELNGIDAARQVSGTRTRTRVILMMEYAGEVPLAEMFDAGVRGWLVKNGTVEELERAVKNPHRTTLKGTDDLVETLTGVHRGVDRRNNLTFREREILQLIGEGNSSKQIAVKLNISATTVKTHRDNIMEKLDLHDVAGLTRASICLRLVSPEFRAAPSYAGL